MNLIHSLFWKFCPTTKSVSKRWRMRINNIFLPLWFSFTPWSKFKGTYEGQIKLIESYFIIKHSNCSIWKSISLSIFTKLVMRIVITDCCWSVVVITTANLHSTKSEPQLCTNWNPTRIVLGFTVVGDHGLGWK